MVCNCAIFISFVISCNYRMQCMICKPSAVSWSQDKHISCETILHSKYPPFLQRWNQGLTHLGSQPALLHLIRPSPHSISLPVIISTQSHSYNVDRCFPWRFWLPQPSVTGRISATSGLWTLSADEFKSRLTSMPGSRVTSSGQRTCPSELMVTSPKVHDVCNQL